jgi:hypothetical protein
LVRSRSGSVAPHPVAVGSWLAVSKSDYSARGAAISAAKKGVRQLDLAPDELTLTEAWRESRVGRDVLRASEGAGRRARAAAAAVRRPGPAAARPEGGAARRRRGLLPPRF